jgi:hypothetical protein
MLRYTLIDVDKTEHTIEGFRPLFCSNGTVDSYYNSIVMIQNDSEWEAWETDLLWNTSTQERPTIVGRLIQFLIRTESVHDAGENGERVEWFIADIDCRTGCSNRRYAASA